MGIARLLAIAGPPLSDSDPAPQLRQAAPALFEMLRARNGFYALDGALHVFPSGISKRGHTLEEWNGPDLWLDGYSFAIPERVYFAENVFGEQFTLGESVELFDPETGALSAVAATLEDWADVILEDNYFTGHSIASQWKLERGPIEPGRRLLPKQPFVVGGQYNIDNLYSGQSLEGMQFRAYLASQIHDLPDGARVVFEISNRPGGRQS